MSFDIDSFLDVCLTGENMERFNKKLSDKLSFICDCFRNNKNKKSDIDEKTDKDTITDKIKNSKSTQTNKKTVFNKKIQTKSNLNMETDYYEFILNKDPYFWLFYTLYNGIKDDSFEEQYENYIEDNIKFEQIEKFKYKLLDVVNKSEYKYVFKQKKIKKIEVLQNLGTVENLSMNTFKILCGVFKIPICFIKSNICEFNTLENMEHDLFWTIYLDENSLQLYKTQRDKSKIEKEKYTVTNLDKPFKSMTSYSLKELQDICSLFSIETQQYNVEKDKFKNKTKKELYSELLDKI
jgi:hypothetical protein